MWGFLLSAAMAASFEGVTDFHYDTYRGTAHIQCPVQTTPNYARVTCADYSLEPFAFGHFTAGPVDADEVRITSLRADGRSVEKSGPYDAREGRSEKEFNLWIETLLQRALLDVGENQIGYQLLKNGEEVVSGSFVATVKKGSDITCSTETIFTQNQDLCVFPQRACREYFMRARCN